MLTHRNTLIFFGILFLTLIFLDQYFMIHWLVYPALGLLLLVIEFYGAYFIDSQFHLRTTCQGKTSEKQVALSFDDGPAPQTEKVLNILSQHGVKASFFCVGKNIAGHESILKRIDSEGHLVGNHSYLHNYWFDLNTKRKFEEDLALCNSTIEKTIHKRPLFFRPPYGVTTPALAKAVKELGFCTIGWNIRSLDTQIKDKETLLTRIKKQIRPGAIILLHDNLHGTEFVLSELITHLTETGYKIVELQHLINKKPYA